MAVQTTNEIDFYKSVLAKVAEAIGITTPLILIANAKPNESYADILIRMLNERLAADAVEIEKLRAEINQLKGEANGLH